MTNEAINIFDTEIKTIDFSRPFNINEAFEIRVALVPDGSTGDTALVILTTTEEDAKNLAIANLRSYQFEKLNAEQRQELVVDLEYGHDTLTRHYIPYVWTSRPQELVQELKASKNADMFSAVIDAIMNEGV